LLEPVGFPDEATLHKLVAEAPQVLPLAGSPRLVVLGSEVRLGGGSADLVAIEPSGRLVIIEVKLARNAEARRAVVAQILTYAAHLRGMSRDALEQEVLRSQLATRGYKDLFDAVEQNIQDGSVDAEPFLIAVDSSLAAGGFRLILVLDEVPSELVRLVGYLESIAPELTIDLITVSRYAAGGQTMLVPQRVDPERYESEKTVPSAPSTSKGYFARDGGADFRQWVEGQPPAVRERALRLYEWARQLEIDGLATLWGYHGPNHVTLLPYPHGHDAGLVTVVGDGSIWTWRSVFEKRAPGSIAAVEHVLEGELKKGGTVREPSDALLAAVRDAYVEAHRAANRDQ
jgi:hypothetical protein